jgi:hypothetical protein
VAESKIVTVVKRQSLPTLVGATALVLVVGLAAGFGLGYQIEKSRTKDDLKKARAAATAKQNANNKNTKGKAGSAAGVRLVGKVDSTAGDAVDITMANKAKRHVGVTTTTLYEKAVPGTAADIKKGERVVWKNKPGSLTAAVEVIVLPANAKLGSLLTDATAGSMTYKANGKDLKIDTTGATVEKVAGAAKADVASGQVIVAQVHQPKPGNYQATEIIVLQSGTKFE